MIIIGGVVKMEDCGHDQSLFSDYQQDPTGATAHALLELNHGTLCYCWMLRFLISLTPPSGPGRDYDRRDDRRDDRGKGKGKGALVALDLMARTCCQLCTANLYPAIDQSSQPVWAPTSAEPPKIQTCQILELEPFLFKFSMA